MIGCFDVIGDIHGCASELEQLLHRLGYTRDRGVYRHPKRKVVFLGDFIDRGPSQRQVIEIVMPMVQAEAALAVMGNHEFNCLAFHTPCSDGSGWLRPHSEKNIKQHQQFLDAYAGRECELKGVLDWFRTLPLWLDLGNIRVIHACWDPNSMKVLEPHLDGRLMLTDGLLERASQKGTAEYHAVETLLKGQELELPEGLSFIDKDGHERREIRTHWWLNQKVAIRDAAFAPLDVLARLPADRFVEQSSFIGYKGDEVPVFTGHYWLSPPAAPLAHNVACVDYSVAKGGRLAAYQYDGDAQLDASKFVLV